MRIVKEFREFAMRGNVIDMAVGIIIGGAFGKIISSIVNDVLMPPLGLALGKVDFKDLKVLIQHGRPAVMEEGNVVSEALADVTLNYGMFIQQVIDFLIIAFCIFLLIKLINSLKRKEVEAPAPPPAPTKEEELLGEIRDLLKKQG